MIICSFYVFESVFENQNLIVTIHKNKSDNTNLIILCRMINVINDILSFQFSHEYLSTSCNRS